MSKNWFGSDPEDEKPDKQVSSYSKDTEETDEKDRKVSPEDRTKKDED